ncbi:MAG: RsmB/NOP family class I SAM-dependent RNA methyltransferase [Sphingobacteriales bacterium]|nr:MAG: RsmB/NOP family class I SAM-dependent RNA methyltransferase [Sphingobacteriales bacterium]
MIPVLKHQNLAKGVVEGLFEIFTNKQYADKVVPKLLQSNPKWGSRDRHAIAFTIYEMVRYWRLLCETAGYPLISEPTKHQIWKLIEVWMIVNELPLPSFDEFESLDAVTVKEKYRQLQSIRAVRESIPDWLDMMAELQLGKEWEQELAKLNQPAPLVIRVNTLKADKDKMMALCRELQINTSLVEGLPDALVIETNKQLVKTPAFQNGWFEVQDAASQLVAPFLNVQPGMLVVDACAGAGGKTLHLAALMKNNGQLMAYDTDPSKLVELKRRAFRNAAKIEVIPAKFPPDKNKSLLENTDRLLLDVPCSGLGTLRRKPDLKWKLTPVAVKSFEQTQQKILERYMPLLKKGGIAVYATCSILPSENEQQVAQFLKQYPNRYKLLENRRISSGQFGFDGFYMAKLQRID